MGDVEALQRTYYIAATVGATISVVSAVAGVTWFIYRRTAGVMLERIDRIEKVMVTTDMLKEAIRQIVEQSDRRWQEHHSETVEWRQSHDRLESSIVKGLESGISILGLAQKELASEMRELRRTITEMLQGGKG